MHMLGQPVTPFSLQWFTVRVIIWSKAISKGCGRHRVTAAARVRTRVEDALDGACRDPAAIAQVCWRIY